MGKHNGKARRTGLAVGKSLENASRQTRTRREGDVSAKEQSVLEQDQIDEILTMADLEARDFAPERQKIIHVDSQFSSDKKEISLSDLKNLQRRYQKIVRIPRRPEWHSSQSPEELDKREKEYFVDWRRSLAKLQEEHPEVLLTPFEKNLEVWRQLWRVLERSSILVQVVDARDPLLYYSEDLVAYARELNPSVKTLVLLNKADLVDAGTRHLWAEYFAAEGILHAFWSAKAQLADLRESQEQEILQGKEKILSVDQLAALLERLSADIPKRQRRFREKAEDEQVRVTVGLVGYPNVGKSSTINALFGKKKTPVAPTPGRTKHFQTLNISKSVCLCDCPGLVLPALARSKAQMVAAGVIPVDRLTDILSPVSVIFARIGWQEFRRAYGLASIGQQKAFGATEVLAALALSRGWTQAAGRPDETKTGRQIIKDFINGYLRHCELPPGTVDAASNATHEDANQTNEKVLLAMFLLRCKALVSQEEEGQDLEKQIPVDEIEDRLMKECVEEVVEQESRKPRRPAHKFHKKPPRRKGNRGRQYNEENMSTTSAISVKGTRGSLVHGLVGNTS